MIKRIKALIRENRENQEKIIRQNQELEWAHVYHDSIRGKDYLENLPLNIGRWAGNYAFFYVLNRIMSDAKPKRILEFGLGESSKFVSACLEHDLKTGSHQIIEQSEDWKTTFQEHYSLSKFSTISVCPLTKKVVQGYDVNCYKGLEDVAKGSFDFYLVDGPLGSPHYSRYDIVSMVEKLNEKDDFIILIDDYTRIGEQETANNVIEVLRQKNILFKTKVFRGEKKVWVLTTPKYNFICTI